MAFIYNMTIRVYGLLIWLAAPFNGKARALLAGRSEALHEIESSMNNIEGSERIWFHAASLGEFEQGRPVIESIREEMPGAKIILTFFSPSGYNVRKDYGGVDFVFYLPADTPGNVARFIGAVKPSLAIFIKYEFWYNYLTRLKAEGVPTLLISALFRSNQPFFRWYGGFFRDMLNCFDSMFVQDETSEILLSGIGVDNAVVSGDTRFDRVADLVSSLPVNDSADRFSKGRDVIVAGSTWRPEEEMIARYIREETGETAFIVAPHEVDERNIERIMALFGSGAVRLSECNGGDLSGYRVLVADTMGQLSSLYRYSAFAVIGGGFGRGIHNILEAAAWGKPVLFGPRYKRFREACELVDLGGAHCFTGYDDFRRLVGILSGSGDDIKRASEVCLHYIDNNRGATDRITGHITRLLGR